MQWPGSVHWQWYGYGHMIHQFWGLSFIFTSPGAFLTVSCSSFYIVQCVVVEADVRGPYVRISTWAVYKWLCYQLKVPNDISEPYHVGSVDFLCTPKGESSKALWICHFFRVHFLVLFVGGCFANGSFWVYRPTIAFAVVTPSFNPISRQYFTMCVYENEHRKGPKHTLPNNGWIFALFHGTH